ncbi:hypothetical protein CK486_07375 [Pseudomonas sp. HAR-UPW-AIA-41]|uniref:UvrD-helicase domain-containing protein n=1 Tax=Pseudomonas sp. HAR-UPW-AIA-41 TaxID=1985301 RepID=UPI000BB39DD9|nr:UvrD-helicase domain-containing protein [Pseudomonas sp. HAR-UPW-AIA-41]PAV48278.1 hypothetical protein CK486_07375 [Pseudomonas sp. HAR-UPW-AIA-41]
MDIKALVVEQGALSILDSAMIDDDWFNNYELPPGIAELRRIQIGECVYILSDGADENSGLLVVKSGDGGVFGSGIGRSQIFERVIRVALRQFDRGISIPVQWQAFNDGALISVYATNISRKSNVRISFDRSPDESDNIYAYTVTDGPRSLRDIPADYDAYRFAVDKYIDALLAESVAPPAANAGNYGIVLSKPLGSYVANPGLYKDWVERLLTDEQLRFVNSNTDAPIRLRGAAGTGKTQAMVIKCLKELYDDADQGGDKTFLFLTHSSALAHEVVRGMLYALDPSGRWSELKNSNGDNKLVIGTLYEIAQDKLGYQDKGLRPIATDGIEGRELQRIIIQELLELAVNDPYINIELLSSCPELRSRLLDEKQRPALTEEIVNEFACVLDPENIRKGTKEAAAYIESARDRWQMQLVGKNERRVILEIYESYRNRLRKENFFSLDQMIVDFCRYLNTYEWDQLRDRDGFDQIYVDEYHYFTKIEAMTFQSLFKRCSCVDGRWPIIMAYDLKQSVTDSAISGGLGRFVNPGVGASIAMDLNTVFRYTPQIANFLAAIDGAFPAMDLEGEFSNYAATSAIDDGPLPVHKLYRTDTDLIDDVFDKAQRAAAGSPEGGRQVAVLCLNPEMYEKYLEVGRIKKYYTPINSREDMKELRYAKKKCIFSIPEYVAGLQFESVFLLHADEVDMSSEYIGEGAKRRYISRFYVGASRAIKNLYISSSSERGGAGNILNAPFSNGSLERIE